MKSWISRLCARRSARLAVTTLWLSALTPVALAAITITTVHDGGNPARPQYVINTDSGLVFRVRGYDNGGSTTSAGDISSMTFNGVEYADPVRGTQVGSGADALYTDVTGPTAVQVVAELVDAAGAATRASTAAGGVISGQDHARVTVTVRTPRGGVFTHYYLARRGEPNIHMGTYFTEQPTREAQARFIARVPIGRLPNGGPAGTPGGLSSQGTWAGDTRGATLTVEASDVFSFPAGHPFAGQTRSKHYANMRLKDWQFFGGTGSGVGIWFWRGNNEGNSGGPFYRSLLQQITPTTNELTYMINYGQAQTEPFRLGVLHLYTMMFTTGAAPTAAPDTRWHSVMGMAGYTAPQGRGGVVIGGLAGRVPGVPYTVGLSNAQAQYWADPDPTTGAVNLEGALPGDYTLTVYKDELPVQTLPVTVTANTSYALDIVTIANDPAGTPALWRIGEWNGTPREFLNGDKLTDMHPSDVRMAPWAVAPFVVGQSNPATDWPAYQWQRVNNGLVVRFNLRRGQNTAPLRLRIGTTTAFAGGRPAVVVNSWSGPVPAATPNVTRNLTTGSYRGINRLYTYDIPASQLVVGTNTLVINTASGTAGAGFLSPSIAFDAIDLVRVP
jgi:rhamnogalacturonan endolyase